MGRADGRRRGGAEERISGKNKAEKMHRASLHIVRLIAYVPILQLSLTAGTPGKGNNIFKRHYAPQADTEKPSVAQSWNRLSTKNGELPNAHHA